MVISVKEFERPSVHDTPADSAECPECHRRLEEYLNSVPENKYVSVDVPMDILEAEKVIGLRELRAIVRYLNEHREGRVKFLVPGLAAGP